MGLSPYSNPCDAGVLCLILVNTAISISMMKEILRPILHLIGIRLASSSSSWSEEDDFSDQASADESIEHRGRPSETYMDEFRSRTPTLRYDSLSCTTKQECSVCLIDFRPDAEINRLSCGHVFHKSCLEKWLNYWNVTCPLCRNHMMTPKETQENTLSNVSLVET
ncbi:probable E3 ubiquitin-protein ligase XERICO [Cynara cardunculus var. scolymus]|uniref:probable E3 ubiquitin-protein ligase XERICO n=1 Tax=Cynara cardunculus var. scolymus TaxID=59895 RepID=UPI000D62E07A|nr:probable E3 ubiquitin-protein ligase XERICO [Cynara cardunculus var. scolymus]XP_024980150.1 probable E3 ubiquitin-protein ligase XERICO [Cynara cardunculus var. scolymus]